MEYKQLESQIRKTVEQEKNQHTSKEVTKETMPRQACRSAKKIPNIKKPGPAKKLVGNNQTIQKPKENLLEAINRNQYKT